MVAAGTRAAYHLFQVKVPGSLTWVRPNCRATLVAELLHSVLNPRRKTMAASLSYFSRLLAQHIRGRQTSVVVRHLGQQIIYEASKARASVPPVANNAPTATTPD